MNKYVIIFFDEERKSTQIIRPTKSFDGNWHDLVETVTLGNYSSYMIKS